MMKRREFLKLSCTGCMLGAAGLVSVSTFLDGCSPQLGGSIVKATIADKKMMVPISKFTADKVIIARGKGMDYDVAIHSIGDGTYKALLLRCTHFSNPLTVNGRLFDCSLHGSQFGADGEVKKGPASQPLQQLNCEVAGNNLVISI